MHDSWCCWGLNLSKCVLSFLWYKRDNAKYNYSNRKGGNHCRPLSAYLFHTKSPFFI